MNVKLPQIINDYIIASNAHDVKSIVVCFSDAATVHDEGQTHDGKKAIEEWVVRTIEKYKFHFQPIGIRDNGAEIIVAVKVSGIFDGSPVTLDYHFAIEGGKITSLAVG